MNPLLRTAVLLGIAASLRAAEPAPASPAVVPPAATPAKAAAKDDEKYAWLTWLLPTAFQKNPRVNVTVITEVTPLGKLLPPVSPAKPAYYFAHAGGYAQLGDVIANEKTLAEADVSRLLAHTLATGGYLPADSAAHPPTLAITYSWGAHNLLVDGNTDNSSLSGAAIAANLLDSAALVGGQKFAAQLMTAIRETDSLASTFPVHGAPGINPVVDPGLLEMMNPLQQLRQARPNNAFLLDQTNDDVYFVIVSAYDFAALTQKVGRLYWRTRMTIASHGVTQEQTLPTLISSAGPYFGKDMEEPEIINKRATPDGTVEVGEPVVIGTEDQILNKGSGAPKKK